MTATVLFRPIFDFDHEYYVPALKGALKGHDFRVEGQDDYMPEEIDYLVLWRLEKGDKEKWPNLKALLSLSAGVNQYIGYPELPENVPLIRMIEDGLTQSMVEYVTSYVLRLHKQHDEIEFDVEGKGVWFSGFPPLANERRVGFLGLGALAVPCIEALKPLGFQLKGWSRTKKEIESVETFAGWDGLDNFLSVTDILVCLLPLTAETMDILNKDRLTKLPEGTSIINVARGAHVVDEDLIACLENGHLNRAVLDVFRKEPLPEDHPFWQHPRVHVTPHVAGITMPKTSAESVCHSIEMLEEDNMPEGLVDLSEGY